MAASLTPRNAAGTMEREGWATVYARLFCYPPSLSSLQRVFSTLFVVRSSAAAARPRRAGMAGRADRDPQ